MSLEVSGSPMEILMKFQAAKAITERYNSEGFGIYEQDEEWNYIPIYDERLCPVCEGFGGRWNGLQVGIEFKDVKDVHPFQEMGVNERYPDVHTTYPWLRGKCRCLLELIDYLYTFTNRLMRELRSVLM